jgi:hypothetical protein
MRRWQTTLDLVSRVRRFTDFRMLMSVTGPSRHFVACSNYVGLGVKRNIELSASHVNNAALMLGDPV